MTGSKFLKVRLLILRDLDRIAQVCLPFVIVLTVSAFWYYGSLDTNRPDIKTARLEAKKDPDAHYQILGHPYRPNQHISYTVAVRQSGQTLEKLPKVNMTYYQATEIYEASSDKYSGVLA